jgi:antirestriction protein
MATKNLSSKAKYIPNRLINEIEVERNGRTTTIDGADLLDGAYVKKGVKFAKGSTVRKKASFLSDKEVSKFISQNKNNYSSKEDFVNELNETIGALNLFPSENKNQIAFYKKVKATLNSDNKYAKGSTINGDKPLSYYKYSTPRVNMAWNGVIQQGGFYSAEECLNAIKKQAQTEEELTHYSIVTPDKVIHLGKEYQIRYSGGSRYGNGGGVAVSSESGLAVGTNADLLMNQNNLQYAKGGGINMDKHIWEGWTVGAFIEDLEIPFRYHAKFKSRDEVKEWAMSNQPYYKKYIKDVVDYYWDKNETKYGNGGGVAVSSESGLAVGTNADLLMNQQNLQYAKGSTVESITFPIMFVEIPFGYGKKQGMLVTKLYNLLKSHNIEIDNSKDWHTKGFGEEYENDENHTIVKFNVKDAPNPNKLQKIIWNLPDEEYYVSAIKNDKTQKTSRISRFKNGGGVGSDETPKVWIGEWSLYNEGKLIGEWVDLSDYSSGDEVMDKIQELLDQWTEETGENREEYGVFDFENFPRSMYSEQMGEQEFDNVIKAWEFSQERDVPMEVIANIVSEYEPSDLEEWFNERYEGQFNSDTDLAYNYVEQLGGIEQLGKETTERYFDYESFGRDLAYDYNNYDGHYFRSYKRGGNVNKFDLKNYLTKGNFKYSIGGL